MRRALTIRMRLTVLYGGLFLLAGIILLGVTYLLVAQRLDAVGPPTGTLISLQAPGSGGGLPEQPSTSSDLVGGTARFADGRTLPAADAVREINQQQVRLRTEALNSLLTQGGIGRASCRERV